jgi:hypothetical protein
MHNDDCRYPLKPSSVIDPKGVDPGCKIDGLQRMGDAIKLAAASGRPGGRKPSQKISQQSLYSKGNNAIQVKNF